MSPTQYRALETLRDARPAGALIAHGTQVPPGRIHPRTADALERRGLATRHHLDRGEELLEITADGLTLLAVNPEPAR